MFSMWYKSTTQVKGNFISYNCKIGDVVWDRVLDNKEWHKNKINVAEMILLLDCVIRLDMIWL